MRLLILIFLAYLLYRVLRWVFASTQKLKTSDNGATIDEMVQDPSCQTYIPLRDSQRRFIGGREYFFCSRECADKFEKEMKG